MPPARKTYPQQVVAETAAKRPWPRHVIDIQDLMRPNENDKGKGHLVVNINEFSPEEISIKRSGDKLTVDTKTEDKRDGQGVEHITRSYKIPDGGYTPELGAQLSADGLVTVRSPGQQKKCSRVIPINIAALKQMKPGTVIQINTANWQSEFPMKFAPYVIKSNLKTQAPKMEKEGEGVTPNHQEMKGPESNADEDMGVPDDNSENISPDTQLDQSA